VQTFVRIAAVDPVGRLAIFRSFATAVSGHAAAAHHLFAHRRAASFVEQALNAFSRRTCSLSGCGGRGWRGGSRSMRHEPLLLPGQRRAPVAFSSFQHQRLLAVDKKHVRITDLQGLTRAFEMRVQ
jgi:hypothetical protein